MAEDFDLQAFQAEVEKELWNLKKPVTTFRHESDQQDVMDYLLMQTENLRQSLHEVHETLQQLQRDPQVSALPDEAKNRMRLLEDIWKLLETRAEEQKQEQWLKEQQKRKQELPKVIGSVQLTPQQKEQWFKEEQKRKQEQEQWLKELLELEPSKPEWRMKQIIPEMRPQLIQQRREISEQKAKELLARKDILDYLCPALQSISNDVFDIAKVVTPLLSALVIGQIISAATIPFIPILYASIVLMISRMGIASLCAAYQKKETEKKK